MKDFLMDLVAHTHNLGFLPLVKVTASENETVIESMAEDRSVIMTAKTHTPVQDLDGVFGMPNLNKLDLHLKCPEYKKDAKITVIEETRNNSKILVGLHFENSSSDYQNDYRFMVTEIINEKLKAVAFKGAKWLIELTPSLASIQRLKFQAAANSEETVFQVRSEDNDLVFSFGDSGTHAGQFVFQHDVTGKLKHTWAWPIAQVQSILNLSGDITMYFSDMGALQITVDSGFAVYNYILPAMTK